MKIKTDPTIRSFKGKFPKSNLIMQNNSGKNFCSAKHYAAPNTANVTAHQSKFSADNQSIFSILRSAHEDFIADLKIYCSLYNTHMISDEQLGIPYQNVFTKLCYSISSLCSIELQELNTENFEETVDCIPTVECLIINGYLPSVPLNNLEMYDLRHHIFSGKGLCCISPEISHSTSFRCYPLLSDILVSDNQTNLQCYYELLDE